MSIRESEDFDDWYSISGSSKEKATNRQIEYFLGLMNKFKMDGQQAQKLIRTMCGSNKGWVRTLTKDDATKILTYLEKVDNLLKPEAAKMRILEFIGESEQEQAFDKKKKTVAKIENKEDEKVNGEMMNLNKMFGGEIGKDKSGMFKVSLMGLAVKNEQGNYVCYNGSGMVDVMDMVADAEDMIYKIPVQSVQKGDLIVANGKPAFIEEVNTGELIIFNPLNDKRESYVPQTNLFGFKFFVKVVSLFDMTQQQQGVQNGFNPMMMLAFDNDDDKDSSKMLMMAMMMQQQNGQQNQFSNMLPFLMMKDSKGSGFMEMIMMQQMMGGQGFNFGFQPPQAPKAE